MPTSRTTTIVHLTTVHPRYDTRIFLKESITAAAAGYRVILVVADGKGPEEREGVKFVDLGRANGRLSRMVLSPVRAYAEIRSIRPDLVHFHDPELIPMALLLHWSGMRVIYDAHEDLPRAILSKHWLPTLYRRPIAGLCEFIEDFASRRFSATIAATPHIAERFSHVSSRATAICNFPLSAELDTNQTRDQAGRFFCFVGAISRKRGIREMIAALSIADAWLILAGPFEDAEIEREVREMPEWERVEYCGVVSREQARDIMARSVGGLLFFHPEPNHVNALPNKMFEYMAGGLPVLCSDFPAWKNLLAQTSTGLCCSPTDPRAIAALMTYVIDHPSEAGEMGSRGRQAVASAYRWEAEGEKLIQLYDEVLGG